MVKVRKSVIVWVSAVLWAACAFAGPLPVNGNNAGSGIGAIKGLVRNSVGKPQMGATVEIFAAGAAIRAVQTAFTDENGGFSLAGLAPGKYFVRVSAPAFLPALRERVTVTSGAHLVLNFTLNTLFEAQRLIPERRNANAPDDDWQWTLRSAANRPVLRVFDGEPTIVTSEAEQKDGASAKLAFLAGGGFDGMGGMPSVTTDFTVEQDIGERALAFSGRVGYGGRDPDGILRVAFARRSSEPNMLPDFALIVRRASIETPRFAGSTFNSFGLEMSQVTRLLDAVDMRYGAEFETASVGKQLVVEPFIDATYKIDDKSRVTYHHRWSQRAGENAGAEEDQQAYAPRLTVQPNGLAVERARHQELGYERKLAGNLITVAYYRDAVSNLALSGIGQMDGAGPDFADAILAGNDLESFTANAGRLNTQGMHVAWQHKFGDSVTATAHYSYGTVLDAGIARYALIADLRPSLNTQMRHAAGGDVKAKIHRGSEVEASYNATMGPALTPVDQYGSMSIASAPFLNLRLRQPLPSFMPAHMEALIDIRNLLAQGYRPVLGEDGRTLYLVQAARSLRGGIAFTF